MNQSHPNERMKVGVALPIVGDETNIMGYPQLRNFALQAEALGVDSVWVTDHLLFRMPDRPPVGIWESWSLIAALAEATKRVEIGTLVLSTPFRNPAVLAKMASTVDAISGGRLILGLGAGWHQPEFEAFGIPFDHLVSRFEEALQIIVPLLREGEVDFQGTYYQARECVLRPRGPRPSGIPMLVGGERPRMLRLTARYADMWNTAWLGQPRLLPERRAKLDAACSEQGRDRASLATTVGITILPPEHTVESPDLDQALFGTAEAVADGLRAYEAFGVAHAICRLNPFTEQSLAWLGQVLQLFKHKS
jgi:alkanesulfonate monooxygenase SsuD/methylene tetrahydromethanopterin reductase-like flavin-dependent oxidoreductase (luciferase family)